MMTDLNVSMFDSMPTEDLKSGLEGIEWMKTVVLKAANALLQVENLTKAEIVEAVDPAVLLLTFMVNEASILGTVNLATRSDSGI
jgi:hypothetical protein